MEHAQTRALKALDDLEREVERASRVIAELRRENAALRSQLESVTHMPTMDAARPARIEAEWRRLQTEREVIADRLKTILGKFQWLEGEVA
jgi:FtsZ-binding cell division protein ZapB